MCVIILVISYADSKYLVSHEIKLNFVVNFKPIQGHANQEALVIKMMMTMVIMIEHTLVNSMHNDSGLINQILSYPI